MAVRLKLPLSDVLGMSCGELSLWAAFLYSDDDLENRRMDERAAVNATVSWNAAGARPQKTVADFMPRRRVKNDIATMQAQLLAWAAGMKR